MRSFITLVATAALLALQTSCGNEDGSSVSDAPDAAAATPPDGSPGSPETGTPSEESCDGNVAGSADVIDGPGPGVGSDSVFRSLAVHPKVASSAPPTAASAGSLRASRRLPIRDTGRWCVAAAGS